MYAPAYTKSLKVEGLISRYTYMAPDGRTPTELVRNYQLEFQRLGKGTSSVPAFDLSLLAAESFSCLVLEMWASEILKKDYDLAGRVKDRTWEPETPDGLLAWLIGSNAAGLDVLIVKGSKVQLPLAGTAEF